MNDPLDITLKNDQERKRFWEERLKLKALEPETEEIKERIRVIVDAFARVDAGEKVEPVWFEPTIAEPARRKK